MSYDLNTATCFTELKSLDTSENVKKYSSTELTKLSQGTDEYYKRQRRFVKLFLDLLIKIHDMDNVVPISTVPSEEIVFNYQNPNEILEPDHRYIKKRVYPKEEEGLPQTKGNDVYYDLTQFHSIKPDHILYPYLLYDYLLIVGDKNTHASLTYNRNTIQDALLYHYQLCKEHDQDLKLLMETTYGNNIILVEDAIPLAINNKKLIEGCLDNYQNNFVYISPKKSVKSMTAAQQIIIFKLYLQWFVKK